MSKTYTIMIPIINSTYTVASTSITEALHSQAIRFSAVPGMAGESIICRCEDDGSVLGTTIQREKLTPPCEDYMPRSYDGPCPEHCFGACRDPHRAPAPALSEPTSIPSPFGTE